MHTTIKRTLTALALTAAFTLAPVAANAASFGNILHLHLHPALAQSTRYNLAIYNNTYSYQMFKVKGVTYAVPSHHDLVVSAPAGTEIYAASKMGSHERGALLFTVTPKDNDRRVAVQ